MSTYRYRGRFTYQQAAELLASARGDSKPLANNTRLYRRGDDYAVRLHSTDVVTLHPDGTYTIDAGGWKTATTKQRICDYSPARLYQEAYSWYLSTHTGRVAFPRYDSVRIDADGYPID